jgi:hypothetical protein
LQEHGPLSKLVNKLLVPGGLINNRHTMFKFCEPAGTPRDALFNGLLVGSRLPASFALKRDLLALRFDGKMPRLRR